MNGMRIGASLRVLRHRSALRQVDVGRMAGSSRTTVARIESGEVAGITVGTLVAAFAAVGARVEIRPLWHGAAMDRLLDEGHARLSGQTLRLLRDWGWEAQVEVSFAHYGERGSLDVLAWHAPTRTLLVVEIKTELGGLDGLLRPLDAKLRLAAGIAAERFGWRAAQVCPVVVLPEDARARRQVARHAAVLDVALPHRSREVRRWLSRPVGALRGLWFLSSSREANVTRNPSAVRRVRVAAKGPWMPGPSVGPGQ